MHKRLIIGAIAVVVIGVAAWIFRPWETRVEFHIRKCHQAEQEAAGKHSVLQRAWGECRGIFGFRIPPRGAIGTSESDDPGVRWKKHQQALLDLGYLQRREFPLTNRAIGQHPTKDLAELARKELPKNRLWRIGLSGTTTNLIVIQVERHDMPMWERMIGQINALKSE